MGSEEQNGLIGYLNALSYEEADFQEGMMAGGSSFDIFINKAGDHRMLEVWASGDIIEYCCDADGTVQKYWIKAKDTVYEEIMQYLDRPLEYYEMPYTTQTGIRTHLTEVFAQMFPTNPQPFMNLLLSSYMPECTVTNTWESGKRFGVTLPDEGVRFTFDTFKMQELFETFDWTPVNVPVQNWTPGYVTMHLGMRSELRFGTTPNDSYGHYLIRYQNGNNEASVYYADEDFMKQFMQLLSSSQDHPHSDDGDSDNKMLISIASDYLRNNVPSVIDTILWDETEVEQINKLPENYVPVAMLEWKYGSELTGDFWLVRFHTTQDALLGTEDVYLTEDGIVIGLGIRE